MKISAFKTFSAGAGRWAVLALLFICALPISGRAKEKWDPISPEDLAATECKAYPGADAEILFERQTLGTFGSVQEETFYRRIKIFSAKGANDAGVLSIDYPSNQKVWGLAAQVTKPDGAKQLFGKADFSESTAVKTASYKLKRLILAVPGLGAGDILDIVWTQSVESAANYYQWWYCQRTLPVREFVFEVVSSKNDFNMMWFNVANAKIVSSRQGAGRLVIKDIPPFEDEPHHPPERDIRGWFMLLYTHPYMRWYKDGQSIWQDLSPYLEEDFRLGIKPKGAIKAKAEELLRGLTTDDEKLGKLYAFCQSHVTNFDYFDNAELQEAKKKLEKKDWEQSPVQTLTLATGTPRKVNELFASLAVAAGYEVRLALCASRYSTLNFKPSDGWIFMDDHVVAVRLGGAWRYYSPGDYFVPAGMLHYSNEAVPNIICDPDKVLLGTTSISSAEKSPVKRTGRFVLDAEGNLEGEVEISLGGHAAVAKRAAWDSKQRDEIETEFREEIIGRMPAAEITDLNWENLTGNGLPLVARFKIKVPAYADVVGGKIIVTPGVFEHGASPIFKSESRKYNIVFKHAYRETDDIEITYPEGFMLEAGSSPQNVGELNETIGTRYQIGLKPKLHRILYKREFVVGTTCATGLKAAAYPLVKKLCDAILRSDEHTLVLKALVAVPSEAPAEPESAPAATP